MGGNEKVKKKATTTIGIIKALLSGLCLIATIYTFFNCSFLCDCNRKVFLTCLNNQLQQEHAIIT
jgi:hypothetical protein